MTPCPLAAGKPPASAGSSDDRGSTHSAEARWSLSTTSLWCRIGGIPIPTNGSARPEDASMSETLALDPESGTSADASGARAAAWIRKHGVREIECLIPDMNGVLRGKVLPAEKFLKAINGGALYMPTSALLVCADGRYSGSIDEGFAYGDPDMLLVPDLDSLCLSPDSRPQRAFILADGFYPADRLWSALP